MKLEEQLAAFHRAMVDNSIEDAVSVIREDGIDRHARLRVYANAYLSRIGGVLEEHYPKLRALLGDPAFRLLIRDYLRAHPPHDPSLREAGVALSRFVFETTKDLRHVEIARLERARTEAFDGPDAEVLTREAVAALPPEEFPSLRLALVPTAKLLILTTNADDVWDALEDDRPAPPRADIQRTVLVWRRNNSVLHRTLEHDEADALHQLETGSTFARVCAAFALHADLIGRAVTTRAIELLLRWLDAEVLAA